jgi:hypothetical protein
MTVTARFCQLRWPGLRVVNAMPDFADTRTGQRRIAYDPSVAGAPFLME